MLLNDLLDDAKRNSGLDTRFLPVFEENCFCSHVLKERIAALDRKTDILPSTLLRIDVLRNAAQDRF